jgi:MarC family membrane protein
MTPEILSSVFLLLLVLDPLGNVPFVLSLLRGMPAERKRRIILRECAIATGVLILFLFVGDWLLAAMHLSNPALEISGGLILFLIALRMVFPPAGHEVAETEPRPEPFIVPLAVPMIAGPSALAMVLLASRQSGDVLTWVGAVLLASAVNAAILLISDPLARLFGRSGMEAMERLMGLILTTMAVQMLISGIKVAFATT